MLEFLKIFTRAREELRKWKKLPKARATLEALEVGGSVTVQLPGDPEARWREGEKRFAVQSLDFANNVLIVKRLQ